MMKVLFSTGFQTTEVTTAAIPAFFLFLNKADFLKNLAKNFQSILNILECGRLATCSLNFIKICETVLE